MKTSRWQHWLTLLTILFLPTQFGKHFWPTFSMVNGIRLDYLSPTIYLTDLLIAGTLLVWILSNWSSLIQIKNWPRIQLNKPDAVMAGLGVISLTISTLVSVSLPLSLLGLLKLAECAFFAWMCYLLFTNPGYRKYSWLALGIGLGIESAIALGQFFNHGSLGGILYFLGERTFSSDTPGIANASINGLVVLRPYGTLPHPNVLAGYMLTIGTLLFLQKKAFGTKGQAITISIWSLSLLALLTTLSRIPIFIESLLILLYTIQLLRAHYMTPQRQLKIGQLTAGLIFVSIILAVFSPVLLDVLGRFLTSTLWEESVRERQSLVTSSLQMLAYRPLFGVGLHAFLPLLPRYLSATGTVMLLQPVHNIVLLVAAEAGLVGELVAVYGIFRVLIHNGRHHFQTIIPLLLLLLCNQFDHYALTLQQGQMLFALLIAYSLATQTMKNQEQTMSQQIF